ncbi:unnamed protein product, partial [Rotaria sp. Silwood2]
MTFWHRRSFSSYVTSSRTINNSTTDQETIERLCDRLQSARCVGDRRDAVHALKALSKKCELEVGNRIVTLLANIIQGDRTDLELIRLALQTLTNLITNDVDSDEEQLNLSKDITIQFTGIGFIDERKRINKTFFLELYIKNEEHVFTVVELTAETDFNVRQAATRFLTALLTNCTEELQDIILLIGRIGFSKLLHLLEDKLEIIRIDAVRLFQILVRGNWNIQGIVTGENCFERVLDILHNKRDSDDDLTIQDCLYVILNLLEDNPPNHRGFCGRTCFQGLCGFFEQDLIQERHWSTRKVTNVHLFLQIIRTLVSPTKSTENIVACQCKVKEC